MSNPFSKFQTETKVIKVKALDNQEVTIRELTVAEANEFSKRIVKNVSSDGSVEIDYKELADIRIDKLAAAMIEPKMSVKQLKALTAKANDAIIEISDAIDKFSNEGN